MTSLHAIDGNSQRTSQTGVVCPPWCGLDHTDEEGPVVHVSAEVTIPLAGESIDAARFSVLSCDDDPEPLIVAAVRGTDTGQWTGALELPASSAAAFAAALNLTVTQAGQGAS